VPEDVVRRASGRRLAAAAALAAAALAGCRAGNGAGGSDAGADGSDAAPGADAAAPAASDAAADINDGFIGGPCDADADCAYAGGRCLTDADGFPGGMCTEDCDLYCPDMPGAAGTFCIDPADVGLGGAAGLCAMRCDYGLSPTGCRDGYQCVALPRHDEPQTVVYACIPGDDMPFALSACHEELISRGVSWTPGVDPLESPPGYPGLICTVEDPVWLDPVIDGVSWRPNDPGADPTALFVSCPLALSLESTSALLAADGVTDAVHFGTYNCRTIAGTDTLSQHGLANAIDVAGLVQADGTYWTVLDDWEMNAPMPTTPAGVFLRDFVEALFDMFVFNIILTPDYNAAHYNHFHCDLTPGEHFLQ
jgi:hypothetical protein